MYSFPIVYEETRSEGKYTLENVGAAWHVYLTPIRCRKPRLIATCSPNVEAGKRRIEAHSQRLTNPKPIPLNTPILVTEL